MSIRSARREFLLAAVTALTAICSIQGCTHREDGPGLRPSGRPAGSAQPARLFRTSDGWNIAGDFTAPAGAKKAVLLLHQRGGSAKDWTPVVSRLNDEGFASLAIDQRGAGRSIGPQNGSNAPWDTTGDIAGAIEFLGQNGIPSNKVALAGASYGANNALLYAASHQEVPAVALLSPGTDYNGLSIRGKSKLVRGSLLVMTARGDSITEGGPNLIKQEAPGAELQEYDGDAHGTNMFARIPETADRFAAFFKRSMFN